MTWGGRCPRCGEVFRGLRDGKTMGRHKSPYYLPFSNRREECNYGGGTVADAQKRITPLMRRTQRFLVREAVTTRAPLTEQSRSLLNERGLLEETLQMIEKEQR